ncbi:DUF397 domain-containing protein, partial [Kitasatospora sp. NPDC089797]|uniref:DUF397 domain-containing protein n=1 Tax=Kitasatospora sp. NPDC089797 TaxID=3155298 RepID=UPI003443DD26
MQRSFVDRGTKSVATVLKSYDRPAIDALDQAGSPAFHPRSKEGPGMDLDLTNASWRKSSHSSANCGACIEVAEGFVGVMPVRDSKDPSGPALLFPT